MDSIRFILSAIIFCISLAYGTFATNELQAADSSIETPVTDQTFEQLIEYFTYDENIPVDTRLFGEWPWRGPQVITKLSYQSVRGQRVHAYLAIPKDSEGKKLSEEKKLPVVLLMHGANLFWGKNEDWVQAWLPILTSNGYAVLAPDHFSFGERRNENTFENPYQFGPYTKRDWMIQTVVDLKRGIDFLEQHPQIDPQRIAVLGGSMGGWIGSVLAAVEPRIKTTVLTVPATERGTEQTKPGMVFNSSNYFPRIASPLMMVVALQDVKIRNARARELFTLVKGKKKLVEYDDKHFLPPEKYNEDILQWLRENL